MSFCESQEIQDLKCSDEHFAVDDGFMYTASLKFFISHCLLIRNGFVFPLDLSSSSPSFPLGPEVNVGASIQLLFMGSDHFFPRPLEVCHLYLFQNMVPFYIQFSFILYTHIPYQIVCFLRVFLHYLYRAILCLV